jgi:multiple sugar transport system substrate-binding protein
MVLFDIMTRLERRKRFLPSTHHMLRRYLTPFYVFTLGLALTLAFSACNGKGSIKAGGVTATKEAISINAGSSTPAVIQGEISGTPTVLPAIPSTPNESTPSPLGLTADDLQGLQVSLWYPWGGTLGTSFQSILDEFNRSNLWGISVEGKGFDDYSRLDEAVEAALTTGSIPDMLIDYGYQAQHWNGNGILADLTPYVTDPVWGLTSGEQADFYPIFWQEDVVTSTAGQAVRIGVPYYRSGYMVFYNQSWAEELGFPNPPKSPEDFRVRTCAAAEEFARQGDKSNLGKGGYLMTSQPGEIAGWIYAFGGEIDNPFTPGYLFNTPETNQAFTYLKGLQGRGCAWFETEGEPQVDFAERRALLIVGSLNDIPALKAAFTQAGNEDQWITIAFPSTKQPVIDTFGPSLLMTHSSAELQLASWLVMQWLVYPPNQAEWVSELEVYPTRQSTLSYLAIRPEDNPQRELAMRLLPDARAEPSQASWRVMRWALEDAAKQLFSPQFLAERVPELIRNLDILANEVFSQVH